MNVAASAEGGAYNGTDSYELLDMDSLLFPIAWWK